MTLISTCLLLCTYWFLKLQIESKVKARCSEYIKASSLCWWAPKRWVERSRTNLIMYSFEFIGQRSNLMPHLLANKMTLATGHIKKKCAQDSNLKHNLDHQCQLFFFRRFSVVGKELELILQSNILILLGALSFRSLCQRIEELEDDFILMEHLV